MTENIYQINFKYIKMMNEYRDDNSYCYFHPTEVVVGVCPFCLNERLLILAHGHHHHANYKGVYNNIIKNKKPHLPKIFAFGNLKQYWKSHDHNSDHHDHDASTSQEDSFISIKFEDNGAASWEKATVSKSKGSTVIKSSWNNNDITIKHKDQVNKNINQKKLPKTMVILEHAKQQSTLRWRKRIGHLFHVMRWNKSSKTTCHVGSKVDGVKVGHKGWIKTLTKRK